MNYYNEHDPKAAAWLRELIKGGHIADGIVDERDIQLVRADELRQYTQCHFFAGIGGWSLALRLAGIADDFPVWTGSCPCQPFSVAGKGLGTDDERHLWPAFCELIRQAQPAIVFGEQVASAAGRDWLAGIRTDLEGMGYEVGAADLCAAGVGAPHIRQRIFWVAYARCQRNELRGRFGNLVCAASEKQSQAQEWERRWDAAANSSAIGGVGNAKLSGQQRWEIGGDCTNQLSAWSSSVAIPCSDGKTRRAEPESFPLADGISGRVGLLRGYGNAIVPQLAQAFIEESFEAIRQQSGNE